MYCNYPHLSLCTSSQSLPGELEGNPRAASTITKYHSDTLNHQTTVHTASPESREASIGSGQVSILCCFKMHSGGDQSSSVIENIAISQETTF